MRAIPMFLTLAATAALGMTHTAEAQGRVGRGRGGVQRPGATRPATPPPAPAAAQGQPAARPRVTGWGPAAMLLRQRDRLQLTDEQVKRLEALANAPRPKGNASDLMRARADLMDAMHGDGNLTAAKAAMDRMASLRTAQALDGLKRRQEARAVLTPAQKAMLEQAGRARAGQRMRQGRQRRGGPAGGPGMGRGMGGGMGRGGMGPGMGRGMGRGMGGRGMGGRGMGGRGMGPGMGPGMNRGMGPGMGPGAIPPGQFPMLDRLRQQRGMDMAPPAPPVPPATPATPPAPMP